MPPKPAQNTKPAIKTTTKPSNKPKNPSKPGTKSSPNHNIPQNPDLSNSNDPQISNRGTATFDLNEPYSEDLHREEGNETIAEVATREEENMKMNTKKKQKEFEVFVGGLDRDATEEDLGKVFEKVGEVVEVRLVKSRFSQKNKGFAFVRFATIDQAKKAALELNFTQVRGKVCEVTRNNDNETLHIGNICTTWTKDMLVDKLRPFELENLEEVLLIEDPHDKRKNRGYAFLNFGTHMDALAACQRLQKGNIYFGTSVRADIAFAKSAVEPDEEIMAQVKSVFLDGLPPSWDEEQVQELFKVFGQIDNIELARNMLSAKRRDFGFVTFRTREAALSCIDVVNKDGIGEGARKVLLKASLRKPLQKRVPSTIGSWRGYNSNSYDDWRPRPRGVDRSYTTGVDRSYTSGGDRSYTSGGDRSYTRRPSRTLESYGRDSSREFSGYSRRSSRGEYETEQSPVQKYSSQLRSRTFQQGPASATTRSRSRGPYAESSSYSRQPQSSRSYEDLPASYSRVSSRGQYEYDDDYYDPQYEYYENVSSDAYDYPAPSRLKRAYSTIDDRQLVSGIPAKRARSGEYAVEDDAYPAHGVAPYEEHPRDMQEDYYEYDDEVYASHYSSRSGASRSYQY